MKTVVFAYHDMGCLGIEALLAAGYEISAIFTHTDNPGEKAFYGSVARLAAERGIPVYAPSPQAISSGATEITLPGCALLA